MLAHTDVAYGPIMIQPTNSFCFKPCSGAGRFSPNRMNSHPKKKTEIRHSHDSDQNMSMTKPLDHLSTTSVLLKFSITSPLVPRDLRPLQITPFRAAEQSRGAYGEMRRSLWVGWKSDQGISGACNMVMGQRLSDAQFKSRTMEIVFK